MSYPQNIASKIIMTEFIHVVFYINVNLLSHF